MDSHVPRAVVRGVRVACNCEINHIAGWQGGIFRNAEDDQILRATRENDLMLVTGDVGTIPAAVHGSLEEGEPTGFVAVIPGGVLQGKDIGAIVRGLVDLCGRLAEVEAAYPVVYLQPPR